MHRRNSSVVVLCLLLLGAVSAGSADYASAGSVRAPLALASMPGAVGPSAASAAWSCLPQYGDAYFILRVNEYRPLNYEPFLTAADVNGDGLDDAVITKESAQTYQTYPLDVLLNDGHGSLVLATSSVFSGTVPAVSHPRQVLIADFNGDGVSDVFVADHGYDAPPFPGYQNTLVLSAPGGKLVNATANLPQQSDFTHSAAAADIDGDHDLDLFIGNVWGQTDTPVQIWLNDGTGRFSVATGRLPFPIEDNDFGGFTTCGFADVNNDTFPDLLLGDAGDDLEGGPDSLVALNNGAGVFTLLPDALPAKRNSRYDMAHVVQPLDLNGDAYIDLLMVYEAWDGPDQGWHGSYIQALVNNGDGTFRDETLSRLEGLDRPVWIPRVVLRDLDSDGDADVLALPWDDQDPEPIVFVNDGSGHFARTRLKSGVPYLYYALLDLDKDGGDDVVFATYAPPEDIYVIRDLGCPLFLPDVRRSAWPW
jgi:hypothetical protein